MDKAMQRAWGRALQARRREAGRTQQEVSFRLGASVATIYRWEAGKTRPSGRFEIALRRLFHDLPGLDQPAAEARHRPGAAA